MCEFCVKHGEGKKWYLQAKNYGEDLASDLRRREFIADFFEDFNEEMTGNLKRLKELAMAPSLVKSVIKRLITRRMKREHFGQVLPIEDVEEVFEVVNSVVRVPCVCRRVTRDKEVRCCFGVGISPTAGGVIRELVDDSYWVGPDGQGLEVLEKSEALALMHDFEKEGLVHSAWTFMTPFIGGICNCDRTDCMGLLTTIVAGVKMVYKAHYVAEIDWDKCKGCRACMRLCQFGAISYSVAEKRCVVDIYKCYGCGVCRAGCPEEAIRLVERAGVPELVREW